MSTPQEPGFAGVADLPPYRAMLVVDMKDYSGAPGRHHGQLNALIPEILQSAFIRCGLGGLWSETTFADSTGDGFAIGLPAERLPFLLNPFLETLQNELEDRGRVLTAEGFEPIRMRVSVTVGPVTDSGRRIVSDGAGVARVELHRLLDSQPVRELLTRSGNSTKVAAIVSARAYEDAVTAGYSDEDPALYVEVPVKVKRYQGNAYLRVPRPSGDLLANGFRTTMSDQAAQPDRHQPSGSAAVTVAGNVRTAVGQATGPFHAGNGNQYFGSDGKERTDDR